jgi:hypothetical protein
LSFLRSSVALGTLRGAVYEVGGPAPGSPRLTRYPSILTVTEVRSTSGGPSPQTTPASTPATVPRHLHADGTALNGRRRLVSGARDCRRVGWPKHRRGCLLPRQVSVRRRTGSPRGVGPAGSRPE